MTEEMITTLRRRIAGLLELKTNNWIIKEENIFISEKMVSITCRHYMFKPEYCFCVIYEGEGIIGKKQNIPYVTDVLAEKLKKEVLSCI